MSTVQKAQDDCVNFIKGAPKLLQQERRNNHIVQDHVDSLLDEMQLRGQELHRFGCVQGMCHHGYVHSMLTSPRYVKPRMSWKSLFTKDDEDTAILKLVKILMLWKGEIMDLLNWRILLNKINDWLTEHTRILYFQD